MIERENISLSIVLCIYIWSIILNFNKIILNALKILDYPHSASFVKKVIFL